MRGMWDPVDREVLRKALRGPATLEDLRKGLEQRDRRLSEEWNRELYRDGTVLPQETTMPIKKNPQDATLRNINALKKKVAALTLRVRKLEGKRK